MLYKACINADFLPLFCADLEYPWQFHVGYDCCTGYIVQIMFEFFLCDFFVWGQNT